MKKTKRLLSLLMAVSLCMSLMPLSLPVEAAILGDLYYEIIDGEVTITGCNQNVSGNLTIPDVIEGYPVTKIGSRAFYDCVSLTGVTLPKGITKIDSFTFRSCTNLTSVTIPKGVTSIGNSAFAYCDNLQNVYFYGEAPKFGTAPFKKAGSALNVCYHTGNAGWENVTSYELTDSENQVVLTESEHFWPQYTYDNNHSCTTDGTERAVCLCCNALLIRKVEGTAAHRYVYTNNDDATCAADGTQTGRCILCGATETVPIPGTALDHNYSDYVFDNNATCTADATPTRRCLICGSSESITVPNTAAGHSFTNYVSDQNYTCMVDGTKTAICDRCDATDIQLDVGSMAHRYIDGRCIYCGESKLSQASICGSVTAFGQGAVLLELVSGNGDGINMTVTEGTYQLDGIEPGEYTLTVSQTGCVVRSYSLTLDEGDLTVDLKLHRYGDINGHGRYNMGDIARIYARVKSTTLLTGYELLCADFTGEGRVNVDDVARVYAIIKGK